ncbi:MAG: hypothetical protein IT292_08015 [Deltaproteobacteria bacterium]|nr:hypothetical protein [Deltaproteobacteria bacterium]
MAGLDRRELIAPMAFVSLNRWLIRPAVGVFFIADVWTKSEARKAEEYCFSQL